MALSFPTSPSPGDVYAAPNGVNYTWDNGAGVWTAAGTAANSNTVAWVNYNSQPAAPVIRAGFNVSSVTKISTGETRVNFTTSLPNTNYSAFVTPSNDATAITMGYVSNTWAVGATTTSILIGNAQQFGASGAAYDSSYLGVLIIN